MRDVRLAPRWAGAQEPSFLKTIFDALPGAVAYWDVDLLCRCANIAFLEWFGKAPDAVLGTHYRDLVNEQFYAANEPFLRRALAGERVSYERTVPRDGGIRHLFVNYIPDCEDDGSVAGFFVQVNDVSAIKRAEAQLEIGTAVFDHTADGIMVTDAAGTIISVNAAFTEISGYAADEAVGRTPHLLRTDREEPGFYESMEAQLAASGRWQGEIWNQRKNGDVYLVRQTITEINSVADGSTRHVSVFSDITELWKTSERIRHLAFHDELTDLPNRAILFERLSDEIVAAERDARQLAVMFIDLDGFKSINDRLGHEAGDALLKIVARQLQALMRRTDMVARIGGDEFVALVLNIQSEEPVARIARGMLKAINRPLDINGTAAHVGVSIGISMYPTHSSTAAKLLRDADAAMYAVKGSGKNSYRFARPAAPAELTEEAI